MNRRLQLAASLLLLPVVALAASRTYDVGAFDAVYVAAGVEVEITLGTSRSVVAETRSDDFDDLRIAVEGNVLKIDRPTRGWFAFSRPGYQVRVATPALRSVTSASGAEAVVKGPIVGDFVVEASSGSEARVTGLQGGSVKVRASSGSDVEVAGTCAALTAESSSGSDLDARELRCESASVQASSGSDVTVYASRSVSGKASSGSDVRVRGAPPSVKVDTSSGADVDVTN